MYLFFDTETSGMIQRDLPLDAPSQPRLVQLAAILTDDVLEPQARVALLVDPEETKFDTGAVKVHGISEEQAQRFGVPMPTALNVFADLCEKCEVVIGHNVDFDRQIMEVQYLRAQRSTPLTERRLECTMALAQPLCMLESRRGVGYKPPTLSEAHKFFFGNPVENAHDALADAEACLRIYQAIKKPQPKGQLSLFASG